jgi:hypothetical protein
MTLVYTLQGTCVLTATDTLEREVNEMTMY